MDATVRPAELPDLTPAPTGYAIEDVTWRLLDEMEAFSPHFFILTLALVGVVIMVAALLSGLIDRADISQVGVFVALGAIVGPLRVAAPGGRFFRFPNPASCGNYELGARAVYRGSQLEHHESSLSQLSLGGRAVGWLEAEVEQVTATN